ncbi:N-acetylglucosamine-6-phosphate deacetylase [Evansella clarkii]|jgi:N-acetylglucosamine-6-phosphate deacetylase|uniref:N-acetylglucosamine-6-phosphate deacetylase n=1 Tax=Evansella clarkii TaxID=79879 RepID=UPI000998CFE0|nr:N-acetylglucosamine-6-phosphate deacetylase [Evansella clarkii]
MGSTFYIYGGKAFIDGEASLNRPLIKISQGKIETVAQNSLPPEGATVYKLRDDEVILPGFIDIHIHGANGADTMDGTNEALSTIAQFLPGEGVTSFLATTITSSVEETSLALKTAGQYKSESGAELLGVHLEGPFINPEQAGAQPSVHIVPPDLELFKEWQKISGNSIRIVTFAPEEKNGQELMKHLYETGVIGSVGHSDAAFTVMQEAEENGLSHATHLFNRMRPLHHREPGVVGSVYLSDKIKAELILDEIHVSPEVSHLSYQVLGSDRLILISDAIRGKGLAEGEYDLGGQKVTISNREARLEDGSLAGSVLHMDHAVRNALKFRNISWSDIVKITSLNAAKSLQIDHRKGRIAEGCDADIVILSHDGHVEKTFCRGEQQ